MKALATLRQTSPPNNYAKHSIDLYSDVIILCFEEDKNLCVNLLDSKNHYAILKRTEKFYIIEPIAPITTSDKDVLVNGNKLSHPIALKAGDVIALNGRIEIVYDNIIKQRIESPLQLNNLATWLAEGRLLPCHFDPFELLELLNILASKQDVLPQILTFRKLTLTIQKCKKIYAL